MEIEPSRPTFLRRLLHPVWTDVVALVLDAHEPRPDEDNLRIWRLVLLARGVPCRMLSDSRPEGHRLVVPAWFGQRAAREIELYHQENKAAPIKREPEAPVVPGSLSLPVAFMSLLVLFHACTTMAFPRFGVFPGSWAPLGSANARQMLNGEWWRAITALTLHGDGAHVVGNAMVGGAFLVVLGRRVGPGLALGLTLVAGVLGNIANAFALGAPHDSIGFSTAVFGAAGLLSSVQAFSGSSYRVDEVDLYGRIVTAVRSFFVPMAAGLGLLAMLGTGGENTDLGAHLFGFLAGLVMGVPLGVFVRRHRALPHSMDGSVAILSFFLLVATWIAVSC